MEANELLLIAFRATLVYFILLFVVRIMGKREIGALTAFDLIVSLIIGEGVDEAVYGNVSMDKFIVLVAMIALWHIVNSWASYKSRLIERITSASPRVLVQNGKIDQKALTKERLPEEELMSELRLMGVDDLNEVKTATLEENGQVSVLLEDWAKPVQKRDLPASLQKAKG